MPTKNVTTDSVSRFLNSGRFASIAIAAMTQIQTSGRRSVPDGTVEGDALTILDLAEQADALEARLLAEIRPPRTPETRRAALRTVSALRGKRATIKEIATAMLGRSTEGVA